MAVFEIRTATIADIPLIRELAEATWEPTYRHILGREQLEFMFREMYEPEALLRQQQELNHRFLLLFLSGAPVGFASFSDLGERVCKLHKLYLLPELQGQGGGAALLSEVEKHARGLGADVLRLNVNRFNKARYFYEKLQYRVVAEVDVPIGDYWMNDYIMEKCLA